MRAKIRPILEECIELGIVRGLEKAHKHTDEPTHAHIWEQIEIEIWSYIDERFEFEIEFDDVSGIPAKADYNNVLQIGAYLQINRDPM